MTGTTWKQEFQQIQLQTFGKFIPLYSSVLTAFNSLVFGKFPSTRSDLTRNDEIGN